MKGIIMKQPTKFYHSLKVTSEYKALIKAGFVDVSSPTIQSNGNFHLKFKDKVYGVMKRGAARDVTPGVFAVSDMYEFFDLRMSGFTDYRHLHYPLISEKEKFQTLFKCILNRVTVKKEKITNDELIKKLHEMPVYKKLIKLGLIDSTIENRCRKGTFKFDSPFYHEFCNKYYINLMEAEKAELMVMETYNLLYKDSFIITKGGTITFNGFKFARINQVYFMQNFELLLNIILRYMKFQKKYNMAYKEEQLILKMDLEKLPLYVSHKWAFDSNRKTYLEMLKNCTRKTA